MSQRLWWSISLVVLLGGVSFLPTASQVGWLSDDYALVYGQGVEAPSLMEAICQGGNGHLSVHRALCYPFIGYVGLVAGPSQGHVIQVLLHLICAGSVTYLLLLIGFRPATATLAAALFAVSPLASQPILWWSAVCTAVSSTLVVWAAIAQVQFVITGRFRLLLLASVLAFTSLLFYELWLAGFVFLWGATFYSLRPRYQSLRMALQASLRFSLPLLAPYALWAVLFKVGGSSAVHQPSLSILRIPVVLVSMHLRLVDQVLNWPFLESIESAFRESSVFSTGLTLCFSTAVSVGIALTLFKIRVNESTTDRAIANQAFVAKLLFAWSLLLGSRLVFIFQGGVALHSRHSYGAAIAVSIAIAVVIEAVLQRIANRTLRAALLMIVPLLLVSFATSSKGIALNYAAVSLSEAKAQEALLQVIPPDQPRIGHTIMIVGCPELFPGEFRFYHEGNGQWLRYLMAKANRPGDYRVACQMGELFFDTEVQEDVRRDLDMDVYCFDGRILQEVESPP